jgi:hypothetical protein
MSNTRMELLELCSIRPLKHAELLGSAKSGLLERFTYKSLTANILNIFVEENIEHI